MNRVLIILKKDKGAIGAFLLMSLIIPIIMSLIIYINSKDEVIVGIYGDCSAKITYKTKKLVSIEEGKKLLNNEEIDAFYDSDDKMIYSSKGKEKIANKIYTEIFDKKDYIDFDKEENKRFIPFLLTLISIIFAFFGEFLLTENQEVALKDALLLTPVRYKEYIFSRVAILLLSYSIVNLVCSIPISILFSVNITNVFNIYITGIISIIFLLAVNLIMTVLFQEKGILSILSKITKQLILVIAIYSMQNNYSLPLPISKSFYNIIVNGKVPIINILAMIVMSIILFNVIIKKFRSNLRN